MSWNPRRMVAAVTGGRTLTDIVPTMMWATPDTIDRLMSAPRGDAPDLSVFAEIPEEGVLLGLGASLRLPTTDPTNRELEVSAIGLLLFHVATQYLRGWDNGDIPTGVSEQPFPLVLMDRRLIPIGAAFIPARVLMSEAGDVSMTLGWKVSDIQETRAIPNAPTLSVGGAQTVVDLFFSSWEMFSDPQAADDSALDVSSDVVSSERKQSRRVPRKSSNVTIIDVRRRSPRSASGPPDPNKPPVEHDHRWPVRGHYRMQPCGPGRERRRRIWIDEYVAGPEDKPVRRSKKVYRV